MLEISRLRRLNVVGHLFCLNRSKRLRRFDKSTVINQPLHNGTLVHRHCEFRHSVGSDHSITSGTDLSDSRFDALRVRCNILLHVTAGHRHVRHRHAKHRRIEQIKSLLHHPGGNSRSKTTRLPVLVHNDQPVSFGQGNQHCFNVERHKASGSMTSTDNSGSRSAATCRACWS